MKILACTSTRSDYDLLVELYKLLNSDPEIDFKLLVSGSHLSPTYGYSVNNIENDDLPILAKIETLIDSDTKQSRLKTASILLQNSVDIVNAFAPDLMLYVGDREDVIIASLLAGYLEVPAIHFWGGDHAADGNIDNPVRHASSKLASIHFVSHETHKQRLLKIGEAENRIYNIGSIALDRFNKHKAIAKQELIDHFKLAEHFNEFALVVFHPLPEERDSYHEYFDNIMLNLYEKKIPAFVSAPNTDPGNRKAFEVIEKYTDLDYFYYYGNMQRDLFLSVYKHAKFLIGNSSSGIVEAASIPLPVINVGARQKQRFADPNVVFCEPNFRDIADAIDLVSTDEFLSSIKDLKNSYGNGDSAAKAYQLIKQLPLKDLYVKKEDPLNG